MIATRMLAFRSANATMHGVQTTIPFVGAGRTHAHCVGELASRVCQVLCLQLCAVGIYFSFWESCIIASVDAI